MQRKIAYLLARVEAKNGEAVLERVQHLNSVEYALLVFGKRELAAAIDIAAFDLILGKLRKVPGLELTKTFVCRLG